MVGHMEQQAMRTKPAERQPIQFESLAEETLARYEKFYFEELCCVSTGDRRTFSIPLSQYKGLHFACIQDTVERLTEVESGRLSTLQWRNFVFAPIDKGVSPRNVYLKVFDDLQNVLPSIFIRSYVYVVFISVDGSGSLPFEGFGGGNRQPQTEDFHTYEWNTTQRIVRVSPSKLSEIGKPSKRNKGSNGADGDIDESDGKQSVKHVDRVFLVSNPGAELQRILDANSDVIDAVKAFMGNLGLKEQTENSLREVEKALNKPGARVLLEGPARSGKTIIAMSLLANDPSARMLLMNWYFYDALQDAFKVWAKQDEKEIARLFSPSQELLEEIALREADLVVLEACEEDPRILPMLLKMWDTEFDVRLLPRWKKAVDGEWLIQGCEGKAQGDIVYVWKKSKNAVQLQVVEKIFDGGFARRSQVFPGYCFLSERPLGDLEKNVPGLPIKWADVPKHLNELQKLIASQSVAEAIAAQIKAISVAIDSSEQRFFHHDRRHQKGLWVDHDRKLISNNSTLVCDEAQRLGVYRGLDECEWVRGRKGRTFLCGDDNQRLNMIGDKGIASIVEGQHYQRFQLPKSVGIPEEIELLVLAMLGEGEPPKDPKSFKIKLLHDDDLGLVASFEKDPSGKKHYAIPMSTNFYRHGYVPHILKSPEPTSKCTEDCKGKYCLHRYIRSLSSISDPKWLPGRKDLSKSYKYLCAEAIMPSYALSAYELISREVESIYLKIPQQIGEEMLHAPIKGDGTLSWIKKHLYVLMTRATKNLVINVEDERLYESFRRTCEEAGFDCQVDVSSQECNW